MATFLNHHSFVISVLVLWIGLAVFLLRDGITKRDLLALIIMGTGFAVSWLALRPGPGTFTDTAQAEAAIGHGRPVLVEFYSNY